MKTNKIWLVVTLVVMLITACASVSFAYTIANPGFESDWTGWTSSGAAISTSDHHSGSKSAKCDSSGDQFYQTVTGLSPNTTYTLQAWILCDSNSSGKIGVRNYGGSDLSVTSSSTSWTQMTVVFTTGASNTSVEIYGARVSGVSRYDDFTLSGGSGTTPTPTPTSTPVPTPTPTPEPTPTSTIAPVTIANPGFESDWTGWTSSGAAISTSDHHSGSKSAKCDSSGDQFYQTVTGLSPNTTYTLQAWIICDSNSSGKIGARNYGGSDVSATSSSTSWTQMTVVFTTGASNTSVEIYGARVSGVSRYDDFTLSGGSGTTPTPTPTPEPTPTTSPAVIYPYDVLSLTNWKLTAWSYAATALQEYFINGNPPLQTYSDNRWFWVSNENGYNWVNFKAYANYPTTEGSSNPRCELREMTSDGLDEIYWDLTSTDQRSMEWICKVTQVPSSGKLCIAQIHAKSDSYDDLIRVQVRAAANATTGATGTLYVMGYVCGDTADDIGSYTLGDELHLEIVAVNRTITLNRVNSDGSRTQLKQYTGIGSTENYFKAGNYLQSKPTSGTGTVMFRYLRTTPH